MIHKKLPLINFKIKLYLDHSKFTKNLGVVDVHRKDCILSTHELPPTKRISTMCSTLQRKLQSKKLHLLRTILLHGIRAINWTREFTRYRVMPSLYEGSSLSHGHKEQDFSKYASRCQRKSRLAHLRRFCTDTYFRSKTPLCKRRIRRRSKRNSVCFGLNHNRFMSFNVPVGNIPQEKRCRQNAYTFRSSRANSSIYTDYTRKNPRCQYSRLHNPRARFIFRNGQGIPGFFSIVQNSYWASIFHCSSKSKYENQKTLFPSRRPIHRIAMRSNSRLDPVLCSQKLPRKIASHQIHRRRNWKRSYILDKQLCLTCTHHCKSLQMSMARRTLLQMGQTTFANQGVSRYLEKCCKDSNMDCNMCICAHSYNQEEIEIGSKPLHNSTGFQSDTIRENTHFTAISGPLSTNRQRGNLYAIEFI